MKGLKFTLNDRAKFHIGNAEGNLKEIFSSDQLFSALINNALLLYSEEEIKDMISLFRQGEVGISSLCYGLDFVGREESKSLYFLPKPEAVIRSQEENEAEIRARKKIKGVSYLSLGAYQKLLANWNNKEQKFDYNLLDLVLISDKFACTKDELQDVDLKLNKLEECKFITKGSRSKLKINRFTNESEDYYYQNNMELIYNQIDNYQLKPFMFCLYQGKLTKKLKASFRLLADEGIGGNRSKGSGYFQGLAELGKEQFAGLSNTGKNYVNFSTLLPRKEEADNVISYQLANRSGYIYSQGGRSYRKKSLRVMKEGCILSNRVEGQILNVAPENFNEHEVLLNGKSFLIGFEGDR